MPLFFADAPQSKYGLLIVCHNGVEDSKPFKIKFRCRRRRRYEIMRYVMTIYSYEHMRLKYVDAKK
jgi:hypothetical protein